MNPFRRTEQNPEMDEHVASAALYPARDTHPPGASAAILGIAPVDPPLPAETEVEGES